MGFGNTIKDFFNKEALKMLGGATAAATLYKAYGDPDIILGFVPLYNIQSYEVAHSQDSLKFRASGTIYLGDQEGQNTGIVIDALLTGPFQEIMLSVLESLYFYCKGFGETQSKSGKYHINSISTLTKKLIARQGAITTALNTTPSKFSSHTVNIQSYGGNTTESVKDVSSVIKDKNVVKGANKLNSFQLTQQKFNTFTVLSKTELLYNMYLQTLAYRRAVVKGSNVIEVSLFLRRYNPYKEIHILLTDLTKQTLPIVYNFNNASGKNFRAIVKSTHGADPSLKKYTSRNPPIKKDDYDLIKPSDKEIRVVKFGTHRQQMYPGFYYQKNPTSTKPTMDFIHYKKWAYPQKKKHSGVIEDVWEVDTSRKKQQNELVFKFIFRLGFSVENYMVENILRDKSSRKNIYEMIGKTWKGMIANNPVVKKVIGIWG